MIKMIIDVDTGIDDSMALLYALKKTEVEVVGITTGCGNVDAFQAAENTCRILDLVTPKQDVPVVVGANQPLEGRWEGVVANIHGNNGIGNVELPPSSRIPLDVPVEDFLNDMAEKYGGELVLVTLGRLTNIALTIKKYPQFAHNIKKVVIMGGTIYQHGNVTPVAEANVAGDPLACELVFGSGMDITVVGLDVTMKTRLKRSHIEMISRYCAQEDKALAEYIQEAFNYYFMGNRLQDGCLDDCPVHDPLAVMAAVIPSLVKVQHRKAHVECKGDYCRGMIVTDLRHKTFEGNEINFALEVDEDAAIKELLSVFWKDES